MANTASMQIDRFKSANGITDSTSLYAVLLVVYGVSHFVACIV